MANIRRLIMKEEVDTPQLPVEKHNLPSGPYCPDCGGELTFLKRILPFRRVCCDSG